MLLEELAEDLVSATSGLLDGRIINIMNPDGIIIASTQPERIGTFHKGARDAAVSGKPVSIHPDQIQEYSGAREGYNMPLRVGGNIIGVVGIYGEPSEIRYLAHLVEVYTEKYYQLEALIRPQYAQGALKSILLSKLLEGSAKSIAEAETLIKSRNLTLRYPVRVALLADNDGKNLTAQQAEAEFHRWESAGALSGTEDLWSLIDGRLILLLSDRPGRKAEDVQTALRLNLSLPVQAPWEIQRAYQQVLLLDSFTDSGRNLLSDPDTRLRYMLRCTAVENQDFAEEMLARLGRNFSPAEQKSLLYTAQCYYACEKSVTRAAAQLYVHKNTLLYRLHKLWSTLGVDDSGEFQQEFTVRLILEYYLGKQGPRALK